MENLTDKVLKALEALKKKAQNKRRKYLNSKEAKEKFIEKLCKE